MPLSLIWYVAAGSAVGGACRFFLGGLIQQRTGSFFPTGTLVVNITGSFLIGLVLRYSMQSSAIEDGDYRRAFLYVVVSVVAAIAGTFVGFGAGRALLSSRLDRI
ncbi:MAG: hypothetical protein M3068_12670 [Gemmatimonadota bacterium]|nr:hypothetical protein [Gemmatimonadota bacterium]